MASKVEICNIALSHIGVSKEIANFETENNEEARALRRFYDMALDAILRRVPWPFATRIEALALVEEEPNTEWAYSYRYPTGCLKIRRILSGIRNDTRQTRVPYKLASDSEGILIYTDEEDAQLEYTVRADNSQIYPADFTMAFTYYLAFLCAPRLTGGDPGKLGSRALSLYEQAIAEAGASAFNEEQAEEEPDSEFIRARE